MYNTDLPQEYQVLAEDLGFSAAELERLSLNALWASFLPEEKKTAMEEDFAAEFARLRARHDIEGNTG
jgi:adenosine deaminase